MKKPWKNYPLVFQTKDGKTGRKTSKFAGIAIGEDQVQVFCRGTFQILKKDLAKIPKESYLIKKVETINRKKYATVVL